MNKFYLVLIVELVFSPFLYLLEFFKKHISLKTSNEKTRKGIENDTVIVGIHDWVGYNLTRKKVVNNIEFDCGLNYQLDRFLNYGGDRTIELNVTISGLEGSDYNKYKKINFTKVKNVGMDFQGYARTIANSRLKKNSYVLLMNSSVEATQVEFLDSYIDFFEGNREVGLLGISYSTKMYQTLIRNNFTPHVQSFFLISTLDIFNEVIRFNGGEFPGQNISNKRMLIRFGEIKLSKIIEKLGYKLAIITEDGYPYIFPKSKFGFQTAFKQWKLPMGEYRHHVKHPNKINRIVNKPS